jgi:DNA polymerase-1
MEDPRALDRVVLVDGSGLLYRAFHALPSTLTTRDGQPTNAVYGFARMFRAILRGRIPSHGAVVFDAGGTTHRHTLDPSYKAHRPRMPDRLRAQVDGVEAVVRAHGFPILRREGVEADDGIATLCRRALDAGGTVTVVSGDKDFVPLLVDDRVRLFDATAEVAMDADRARRRFGVPPERFADWLALVGDAADGVPGVPGVGPQIAARLLADHADLDALLEAVDALGPLGRTLARHTERIRLSRALVTLKDDVEVPDWDALVVPPVTAEDLNAVYQRFGFVSLLTATRPSGGTPEWFVVDTLPMLAAALQNECMGPEPVAVHVLTELDGVFAASATGASRAPSRRPSPPGITGIALSPRPGRALYLPFAGPGQHLGDAGLAALAPWLANPAFRKVVHDGRVARVALGQRGIVLAGVVGDTALGSYLLDPTADLPHRLEQVARRHLHRGMQPLRGVIGSGRKQKRFDQLTVDRAGAWANHQADAIGEAWRTIQQKLREEGLFERLVQIELPLGQVLADLEQTGVLVDTDALQRLGDGFMAERATVAAEVHRLAGRTFNVGSPKQLGTVLFDELGLPVVKRTKTGYSTAAEVLDQLDHPIVAAVKRWRTLDLLVNTWTDVLVRSVSPVTGRIHPTLQQTASASGRLISTDPDLQRTPVRTAEFSRLRDCFVAAPGHVVMSADWSQIELRVLAHLSQDPLLLAAFRSGADLHRQTAAALFGCDVAAVSPHERNVGKTVNFATVYGQGATALAAQLDVAYAVAKTFIDRFFTTYAGVRSWRDVTVARAHQDGFVTTLGGRRRFVPELSTRTHADRAYGERIAMNTPVQGSAADLCKDAMLLVDRRLRAAGLGARMTLQIHDELLFEVPEAEVDATRDLVREAMATVWTLTVPLVVEVGVGRSWAAAKEASG